MRLVTRLIFLIIMGLPLIGWGTNIRYMLDVTVDTQGKTLTGIAHLRATEDQTMTLSVKKLSHLTVDGKAIIPDKGQLTLGFQADQEIVICYEALLDDTQVIDQDNVFLTENWYPQQEGLVEYALSINLPNGFQAISEADSVEVQQTETASTFQFQFNHPLDSLNLAASKNYVLKTGGYKDIAIEAYFFPEEAHLAETYIEYSKKYLAMYEAMLTPYPYKRFAIVENIFPTGYSMPTYTLLGRAVVRLPFIVKTSLGHEILHQWFGNSVFIDYDTGNWAEGLTNYLADYHYAELNGGGIAYRKQIMLDYHAYVNTQNAIPVSAFKYRHHNKAHGAIGYGKVAMIFLMLRKQYGDDIFFAAMRDFIQQHSFRIASWHDIQQTFEKVIGENLSGYFTQWVANRQDIPHISAKDVKLLMASGKIMLSFTLVQHTAPYNLQLPISIHSAAGKTQRFVDISSEIETINLQLDEVPTKVVIDEDYGIMRQLLPKEISPTVGGLMGKNNVIVANLPEKNELYQPLIDALGIDNITLMAPKEIKFEQLKAHSFIIMGFDTPMVEPLFGKQPPIEDGVRVVIHKNPYNEREVIALLQAKNADEVKAVARKLSHYGKYSTLAFTGGQNTAKTIIDSIKGMPLLIRSPTHALQPDKVVTLNDIIPNIQDSQVIYLGERHDLMAHHVNQLKVIKERHEAGAKIAVGMEMFQIPYQKVLDDYLAGRIDEWTFLKKSQYFNNWRIDYNLYKPIIDYVKDKGIPLIALSIDKRITDIVIRQGIDSLTAEEKQQLPLDGLDFSNDTYRQYLYQAFLTQKELFKHQDFDYFLQTQILWDETMAQSAYQFLTEHPNTQLIVLAGNGHIMYQYGIPNRLSRRIPASFTTIVQDEVIDNGIADYILQTKELKVELAPKLGIGIEEKDNQVIITSVSNNTPAKRAGLQVGDIIIQLARQTIRNLGDLKLALFYSKIGRSVTIQIVRNGKTFMLNMTLFEFKQPH